MSYKLSYTTEEKIKLAKDNSIDQIYDSKKNQRAVRVITVFVSILFNINLYKVAPWECIEEGSLWYKLKPIQKIDFRLKKLSCFNKGQRKNTNVGHECYWGEKGNFLMGWWKVRATAVKE